MSYLRHQNLRLHDLTHSPVGLWQLNGDRNDSSGNGINLTSTISNAGRFGFVDAQPGGLQCAAFDGRTGIYNGSFGSQGHLRILGDITIEFLLNLQITPGFGTDRIGDGNFNRHLVAFGGTNSNDPDTNNLYTIGLSSSGQGLPPKLNWLWQISGTQTFQAYTIEVLPDYAVWHHVAARRESNVVTFFMDGRQIGPSSGTLTAPFNGSESRIHINDSFEDTSFMNAAMMLISSVKIVDSALTDAQIQAEADRTIGV